MLKIITKMLKTDKDIPPFTSFKQGSGRGVDDDMFNVLYLIRASELWFGSWWEVVSTLRVTQCSQNDVLHTVNSDKGGAQRLSSSSADAYVGPACGYKAVLAEALVWAGGVHAAGVFAGSDVSSWLCTLVDVWREKTKTTHKQFLKS